MGIALVNIAIIALVFTSIWPFPSGEFKVELPNSNDVSWSYSDGIVHVLAPYTIDNGWIYDVDDLEVSYSVTNQTGKVLAAETIPIGVVPAGEVKNDEIDFTFNLTRFYNEGGMGMIFRDDSLHFEVSVSCMYTMKLIKFEATYETEVLWDALIRGYGVTNLTYTPAGATLEYYIETSAILAPLGSVPATISVYDGNGDPLLYPPVTQSVRLGTNSSGVMTFTPTAPSVPPTSIEVRVQLLGFQFVMRWP